MFLECFPAKCCNAVFGVGFFSDELLFDTDITFEFQRFDMRSEVAIGNAQEFFQRIEVGIFIDHQNRHHTQSYSVVESLVDIFLDVCICILFYIYNTVLYMKRVVFLFKFMPYKQTTKPNTPAIKLK